MRFWCKDNIQENIAHKFLAELYFILMDIDSCITIQKRMHFSLDYLSPIEFEKTYS